MRPGTTEALIKWTRDQLRRGRGIHTVRATLRQSGLTEENTYLVFVAACLLMR